LPGKEDFDDPILCKLQEEAMTILREDVQSQKAHDDYQELLHLSLVFLGGEDDREVSFRAPGAMHHARWMAKAIYALKLYLFHNQFKLTQRECNNTKDLALFVSLVYARFWNEAPQGHRAPLNDILLLRILQLYPNKAVAQAATAAFRRHLWFLSEHLVGLAFFDERVDPSTKQKMVENLKRDKHDIKAHRVKLGSEVDPEKLDLSEFVTSRTKVIFNVLKHTVDN